MATYQVPAFASIRDEFALDIDDQHVHTAILLWATTVGLTSLEVFGQFDSEPRARPAYG